MVSQTENFKAQYDKLSSIASELKTNPELDIDVLLSKVKEAVACHRQCKSRLEIATKELDSILQETAIEEPDITFKASKGEESDTIPF
jgi:exodeoxyribonuclease VII small subunit